MLDIYIIKIEKDLTISDFGRLLNFETKERKERIVQFHRFEDSQRSLIGNIVVRYAISNRLGICMKDLVFGVGEYGKPFLIPFTGIHFSVSHSGNWVVCAVGENPVGIDVEKIKPIDLKIARRFFSREEYFELMKLPRERRVEFFYTIWTLKESYIKAEGKGLSIPLNSFSMRIDDRDIVGITIINNEILLYGFDKFILEDNAAVGICSIDINQKNFIYLTINKLEKLIF